MGAVHVIRLNSVSATMLDVTSLGDEVLRGGIFITFSQDRERHVAVRLENALDMEEIDIVEESVGRTVVLKLTVVHYDIGRAFHVDAHSGPVGNLHVLQHDSRVPIGPRVGAGEHDACG